jgi:hypothetical protein
MTDEIPTARRLVRAAIGFILFGCAVASLANISASDIAFVSVRLVDYHDQQELPVPCSAGLASGSTVLPHSVSRADLCVTEGTISEIPGTSLFNVDSPKMRAYVNAKPLHAIEARFTYLGASSHDIALGSGTMRRQFGFKLRAQDACNLVYAMWRIEPESKLVVSVKENPGQHTSAECGNRGYRNIKPQAATPTPNVRPGDVHALRAELTMSTMKVYIDETLAWQGPLGVNVVKWDERVGIRSDNARVQFDLRIGPIAPENLHSENCRSEPSDAE